MALSADGNTAAISGCDNIGAAAWFFTRSSGVWAQQGPKQVVGTSNGCYSSVALSADGNTAVVGQQVNGAWVFTRSVGLWTQQAHLQITGLSEDAYNGAGAQGYAVAIAGDANTIAVGAPFDDKIAGATAIWPAASAAHAHLGYSVLAAASHGTRIRCFRDRPGFHSSQLRRER